MDSFPIFLKLEGRRAVVVGGSGIAARKARLLLDAGARVVIVAPALDAAFGPLTDDGGVTHLAESFRADHLTGAVLVVAADVDPAANEAASTAAHAASIPVNVVDRPELCSFLWPAIVDRAPVVVAVSTGGAAPVLARMVRARIEALLPTGLGALAALAGAIRPLVARTLQDARTRRRFWENVLVGRVAELAFAGRIERAHRAALTVLARAADRETRSSPDTAPGVIHVVTVAVGDPESLTLRGLRLLQSADVIVHDRAVGPIVLDFARRDAHCIALDRAYEAPSRMLAMLARGGRRVVQVQEYANVDVDAADDGYRDGIEREKFRVVQAEG